MDYEALAQKFGAAPAIDYSALAAKFGAAPAKEPTNPAAANPEVVTPFGTIKGEMGESAMFNPAAAIIGAGDLMSRVNRGYIQAKEYLPSLIRGEPTPLEKGRQAGEEFARQPMKELRDVHPGSTQMGEVAAMVPLPAAALPVIGALEEGSLVDRAKRAGLAVAGNKLTKEAGAYMAKAPERAAASKAANAERDAIVQEIKDAGITLPPSVSGGGIPSRLAEGVAGKAKTEQLFTTRNQPVIDSIGRAEVQLAPDTALTVANLEAKRAEAYATGYKPIIDIPEVLGDTTLLTGLRKIAPSATGGAIKSPARAEIDDMVGALASHGQWTGADLVKDIQSLREQSRALYGAADRAGGDAAKTSLAKAQREAADMLEQLAERNIIRNGGTPGAVKDLRSARELIAKTHDIEDALVNGSIDATKIKGDRLTGGLATIAKASQDKAMRKSVSMPVSGANVPITVLDTAVASALGLGGAGVGGFAWPAARAAARYGIASGPVQRAIRPDYNPSLLSRGGAALLDNKTAPALAAMYGIDRADSPWGRP